MAQYILHPEVRRFIKGLSPEATKKTAKQLFLLETFGRQLPPPDSKKVSKELFELRIQGPIQVRLLYGFLGDTPLIVNGFIKKTQKMPPRMLKLAHKRFSELAQ